MGLKKKFKKAGRIITTPVRKPVKLATRPFRAKWQQKQHAKAIAYAVTMGDQS